MTCIKFQINLATINPQLVSIAAYQSFVFVSNRKMYHNDQAFTEFYIHYASKRISWNPNNEIISPKILDQGAEQIQSKYKLELGKWSILEASGSIFFPFLNFTIFIIAKSKLLLLLLLLCMVTFLGRPIEIFQEKKQTRTIMIFVWKIKGQ